MDISALYERFLEQRLISTDTRNLPEGCLFFALRGENFNGNEFALRALEAGAGLAVIDEDLHDVPAHLEKRLFRVTNVLEALQELARHHRRQLNIPVTGITGSNGKTTSKELLASVMSQRFKTFATKGNLNNHIGVPLSVLAIGPDTEFAIIEMGANHQKEVEFLCGISMPDHGLVTNVGLAHLEGFGGFEGVKKGKKELFDWLAGSRGTAFVMAGSEDLLEMSRSVESRTFYGKDPRFSVSGSLKQAESEGENFLAFSWSAIMAGGSLERQEVQTHLSGDYNLDNALAAIAVALHFGLNPQEINAGLEAYVPENNRSQIRQSQHNTLFLDYYNANPSSMQAAIKHFLATPAPNKMLILGDMFELGDESQARHAEILNMAEKNEAQYVFLGKSFSSAATDKQRLAPGFRFFETSELAGRYFTEHPVKAFSILVKGSRGMQLEKIVPLL